MRRWAEGCTIAKRLHLEIKQLGYRGWYTHLARFVTSWRRSAEGRTCRGRPPRGFRAMPPAGGQSGECAKFWHHAQGRVPPPGV